MGRVIRIAGWLIAGMVVVTGCSGDDGSESTTTTSSSGPAGGATTVVGADDTDATAATTPEAATSTTTQLPATTAPFEVPGFTIVSRTPGEEGDTVVVLLDTDSYESLTDIDLQNVIADVVDEFPPVYEAHVVDSPVVVDFVTAEELDDEQQQLLNVHYLVRLEEGFRIRYLGAFEANGVTILGS